MPDISTRFMGIDFRTPFVVAAGQATLRAGAIRHVAEHMAENEWSGYVTKSVISAVQVCPRPYLWTSNSYRLLGMQNAGPTMQQYSRALLKTLKEDFRISRGLGLVPIVSLVGESIREWREMARRFEDIGAAALELNLSCPLRESSIRDSLGGYTASQDPEKTYEIVKAVSEGCSIPVMAKLGLHVNDIGSIARTCQEAGARGVSAINTLRGAIGIDIHTGGLLSSDYQGRGYVTGLSGPLIRPFGLGAVLDIGRATDLPVCAVGGIDGWSSAVEYILAGAGLTQSCSPVMWHGFRLGREMARGLTEYMEVKGYSAIEDFRGSALKSVIVEPIDCGSVKAIIDNDSCSLCLKCVVACRDASFSALKVEGRGRTSRVVVRDELCDGCGLCAIVCKSGAISYAPQ